MQSVGAGIRLLPDDITPESLRTAVTAVLDDPAYATAATAIESEIAAMPPAADVLDDLVEPRARRTTECLTADGRSTRTGPGRGQGWMRTLSASRSAMAR